MLLTKVGDEKGEGNIEGEQVITESYIFLDKGDLEFGEWDFAEFKRDKLTKWTRAGYVFEGEYFPHQEGAASISFLTRVVLHVQVDLTLKNRLRSWRQSDGVRGCLDCAAGC